MNKEKGGFAFPHFFTNESIGDCSGMSLRDYFAAKAPKGIPEWFEPIRYDKIPVSLFSEAEEKRYFKWRFYYADAMLKAREENER